MGRISPHRRVRVVGRDDQHLTVHLESDWLYVEEGWEFVVPVVEGCETYEIERENRFEDAPRNGEGLIELTPLPAGEAVP